MAIFTASIKAGTSLNRSLDGESFRVFQHRMATPTQSTKPITAPAYLPNITCTCAGTPAVYPTYEEAPSRQSPIQPGNKRLAPAHTTTTVATNVITSIFRSFQPANAQNKNHPAIGIVVWGLTIASPRITPAAENTPLLMVATATAMSPKTRRASCWR